MGTNPGTNRLQDELLALERKYWQAMQDKDVETALSMTHDPCVVAGPQGTATVDKASFEKMMKGAKWTLHEFEIKDPQVQRLSDDVAILAYKVHERLTVEGEPLTLEAADASTWVRRDGQWLCALHTESPAGDPYGRDRKSA